MANDVLINKSATVEHCVARARKEYAVAPPKPDNRPMYPPLAKQLPSITVLCERYGVAHMELFGSATGPDFHSESGDHDFLVELDKHAPGSPADAGLIWRKRWRNCWDAILIW